MMSAVRGDRAPRRGARNVHERGFREAEGPKQGVIYMRLGTYRVGMSWLMLLGGLLAATPFAAAAERVVLGEEFTATT